MDIAKIVEHLRSERENIDLAIQSLERLAFAGPKQRGRPRKNPAFGAKVSRPVSTPKLWLHPETAAASPERLELLDEHVKRPAANRATG